MGHIRLGNLPATKKWKEVVALLDESDFRIARIAEAVERATDTSLAHAVDDPAFVEALWLLLKIPQAAKTKDFQGALAEIGIRVSSDPSLADILAGYEAAVERARRRSGSAITDFSLLARNAAMAALNSLALDRSPSLWVATQQDERTTIATFGSTEHFGELAQRLFTNLLEGHIRYFLDREISRHMGPGCSVRSVADARYFEAAVHRHCKETTIIMRAFAKDWLGKNRFHLDKDITRHDATGFASYAFTKVRSELSRRSGLAA